MKAEPPQVAPSASTARLAVNLIGVFLHSRASHDRQCPRHCKIRIETFLPFGCWADCANVLAPLEVVNHRVWRYGSMVSYQPENEPQVAVKKGKNNECVDEKFDFGKLGADHGARRYGANQP
jgi:hypothetical protein